MKQSFFNLIKNSTPVYVLLILLCFTSCWDGFSDVEDGRGHDTDAASEVIMTDSSLTITSITLNWTEPEDIDFSNVIVTWTGITSGITKIQKGTTQCVIPGSSGNEFTITLKTVDITGNESSGVTFKITIPGSALPLRFIYNQSQLTSFSSKYTILMADISLTGTWTPSSLVSNGIVDGNGHVIRNVTCSGAAPIGFFTFINTGSKVKNLGLENVNISGTGSSTGGIAGYNNGILTNCCVTGTITGQTYIGGLTGNNGSGSTGVISDSHASVNISGSGQIHGGLVGNNATGSTISNCYASGSMTGSTDFKGGLAGRNYGNISDSHSSVAISGSANYYGGLVGEQQPGGTITKCYATGNVTGNTIVGGLVGINYASVEKCFATGYVTGNNTTGGLVGLNSGTINCCYTTGNVGSDGGKGGIAGESSGTIKNCYSSASVSGAGICGKMTGGTVEYCYFTGTVNGYDTNGIVGYISAGTVTASFHNTPAGFYGSNGTYVADINNMKIQSTYTGWDFTTIWSINAVINSGYPYLTSLVP